MHRKAILLSLLMLAAAAVGEAQQYTVIELPPLQVTDDTGGYGISENGYIAGHSGQNPVRWTFNGTSVTATLNLGGPGEAFGVNNFGHVVGTQTNRAFYWTPAGLQLIPATTSQPIVTPIAGTAISNSNRVAGFGSIDVQPEADLTERWAYTWAPGKSTQRLPEDYRNKIGSSGYAISTQGFIAGSVEILPEEENTLSAQEACLWFSGNLTMLGALPIPEEPGSAPKETGSSVAYGINDDLIAVGESNGWAVQFSPLISLKVLGAARDINNSEVIVGFVSRPVPYAFIKYPNGAVQNLGDLIPAGSDWNLLRAYAINDLGWIVGVGIKGIQSDPEGGPGEALESGPTDPSSSAVRGFVLVPQPMP